MPPRTPLVGVGAVVWNTSDQVVLIRRGQEPRRGEWSIPGGKLEWGETIAEGLRREVREETGLVVEILGLIDVADLIHRDETATVTRHYALLDFLARPVAGELAAASDALEARWVPRDALGQYGLWTETLRIIEMSARMRR